MEKVNQDKRQRVGSAPHTGNDSGDNDQHHSTNSKELMPSDNDEPDSGKDLNARGQSDDSDESNGGKDLNPRGGRGVRRR